MRKDKPRDIARSVLPSTARKSARDDKRNYKSKHRAKQNRTNRELCRYLNNVDEDGHIYTDVDLFDDYEEQLIFDGYDASTKAPNVGWDDMNDIVQNRRDHDKLGPLIRWARTINEREMQGWSDRDKSAYFKAVLPDTLQGRHALGHVEQYLGLRNNEFYYGYYEQFVPTKWEDLFDNLMSMLSTPKGRQEFYDFRLDTIPVAAHTTYANNKVETLVQAVNEEGLPLYYDPWNYIHGTSVNPKREGRSLRPYKVRAYVPQPIAESCNTCRSLREADLLNGGEVADFVNLLWSNVRNPQYRWERSRSLMEEHSYMSVLFNHIKDYKS